MIMHVHAHTRALGRCTHAHAHTYIFSASYSYWTQWPRQQHLQNTGFKLYHNDSLRKFIGIYCIYPNI